MKISCSLYSFGPYLKPDKLGVLGCMDYVKELGFDGVEFLDRYLTDELTVDVVREHAEKIGLPIVAYICYADFLKYRGTATREEIERVKGLVDDAARIGAPKMRHDVTYGLETERRFGISFDAVLPRIADATREVTEYAAERGVMTMFENHGFFLQDADRCEKLLEAVGHPNFGLLMDLGNFMCADEKSTEAVGKLARYAIHVHGKDFFFRPGTEEDPGEGWFMTRGGNYLRGTITGHGVVNVPQCLKILSKAGYDQYVSIEFEGMEDNLKGIRVGFENLKRFVGRLG